MRASIGGGPSIAFKHVTHRGTEENLHEKRAPLLEGEMTVLEYYCYRHNYFMINQG
jgi:hypothetical protein